MNGSITFAVDGTDLGSVVPVLYVNGGPGGTTTTGGTSIRLEVTATAAGQCSAPAETFGTGGATTFTAQAATSGDILAGSTVTGVDKSGNTFVLGTGDAARQYTYDANDLYTVDGISVGMAAFEAQLSTGDTIGGSFTTDPAGVSQFNLDDVNPPVPDSVTAENGTGANLNDITVTVAYPGGANVDAVVIQRAPVTGATGDDTSGTVGTYTTVATVAATANPVVFVDNDVPVGTYRYRAALVNDGDQSAFVADTTNESSVAPTGDMTAPLAVDAVVTANGGFLTAFDGGDVFSVVFNEAMAAPVSGDIIRATDADGTVADFTNGTNGTFSLNAAATMVNGASRPANTVLTVTLTASPTIVTAGTTAGLQIPATVTEQSGTTDLAGNLWNVAAANQDVLLDQDASDTNTNSLDTTGASVTASTATAGGTTATFTFDEAIVPSSATCADITMADGTGGAASAPTCNSVSVSADGLTATVNLSAALTAGNTVTLAANAVTDLSGNTGPAAAVTVTSA